MSAYSSITKTKVLNGYDPVTGTWPGDGEVKQLLAALRTGCSLYSAAAYARTTWNSVRRWQENGRMLAADPDLVDRMELELGERVYFDFANALEVTLGTVEVELAGLVRNGCREKPELALQVLSRRYSHWREQKALDVTSGGASLVQDRIAGLLTSDPQLAVAAESFALALEEAAGDGDLLEE